MPDSDFDRVPLVPFRPGWPDIHPTGLIIGRVAVTPRSDAAENFDGSNDANEEINWRLHVGVGPATPRMAFLGDLTVSGPFSFAGVTVVMPFELRDEPVEITDDVRENILHRYGHWVSDMMYDHAAMALRASLAGHGMPMKVPYGTADVELHPPSIDQS